MDVHYELVQRQVKGIAAEVEIQTVAWITTRSYAANSQEHHLQPLDVASSR